MASKTAKVGPRAVAAMKPGDVIWDAELSRFGVRKRADTTTYFVKVRIDRRQRWINLGRDGPLTPAQARAKARHVLGEVDSGRDPARDRDAGKSLPLFGDFADLWLKQHVHVKRKAATHAEYKRITELHLKPQLAKIRVDRVNQSDVLSLHADLATTPYQANRAVAVLSAMMSHAEMLKYRPQFSNPCRGVERFKERKRKRPLTVRELAVLWRHLARIEHSTNPYIVGALRLLLLTGMRREEVLTLKRSYVQGEVGEIRLPDTKTGPRTIILSKEALQVIHALPEIDDNPYVFPGLKKGQRLINISDTWQEIRALLGFPDVRIHDLRRGPNGVIADGKELMLRLFVPETYGTVRFRASSAALRFLGCRRNFYVALSRFEAVHQDDQRLR